jgi:RNA polymerase sigma-70 factor, ECF subfamily
MGIKPIFRILTFYVEAQRMAAGPPNLQTLIDEHYAGLYRYGYRLSGRSADAEDLVQETFRRAYAQIGQLRNPDRAKSWLYQILRNNYLLRIRKDQRQSIVPGDVLDERPAREDAEPLAIDPADLQAALDDLDESFRTPVILFYFEEFSYKEIADHLGLPIGTVMSRLARAKSYLRGKLAKYNVS